MGPELALSEALLRLAVVAGLAGAIGIERELREQEAGLRTHMLVGVGAALFVLAGNFAWSELTFGNDVGIVLDPSRVVAYVVTGVGFLGAGAIMKNGGSVRGLTTAASLWVVAAIGVVIASGEYALGVIATAAVLLSLWPLRKLAAVLGLRPERGSRLVLELEPATRAANLIRLVEASGVDVQATSLEDEPGVRRLTLWLAGREGALEDLLDRVADETAVRRVSLGT